jgi:hypothetical protein
VFFYFKDLKPLESVIQFHQVFDDNERGEVKAELQPPAQIASLGIYDSRRGNPNNGLDELVARKGAIYEILARNRDIAVLGQKTNRPTATITRALIAILDETSKREFTVGPTCDCGLLKPTHFEWVRKLGVDIH